MSNRKASDFVQDILDSIDHIELFTIGFSFEQFTSNYLVNEACLYNIQKIGEAVSKISEDIREAESDIPWNQMKGMRNRLIHDYTGTDFQIVWNVITQELPVYKTRIQKLRTDLINLGK